MITEEKLKAVRDFFNDDNIDVDWLLEHIDIQFDDLSKTVKITICNMNEQEYGWLKS